MRPQRLLDFRAGCWWHRTSPDSHFTRSLVCSKTTVDGRISLSGRRLIRTVDGTRHEHDLTTDAEVLDAYDAALEGAGFQVGARQQPVEGLDQGVYLQPDGNLFSVIVIGADSFGLPDLEGLAELVPPDQTLIVLLAIPTEATE